MIQTYRYLTLASSTDKKQDTINIGKDYNATTWQTACGKENHTFSVAADTSAVLVVFRIEHSDAPGTDTVQVFVNPPAGSGPTSPAVNFAALTLKPVDLISIRSGNGRKIFSYDEIRIGTTFADVVPPAPASDSK